ncbi:MAG: carboxylating nicotinate-nucleotide diphosphorylase [Actinomycetota bacterium]
MGIMVGSYIAGGELDRVVAAALAEDVGPGDVTSLATVPADAEGRAVFLAKDTGVLCGLPVLQATYAHVDPAVRVTLLAEEGCQVQPGVVVAAIEGSARSLLTGERVALNFLQHLSGISTRTARFVNLVKGTDAKIVDTRKTIPGLRALAKYAVRMGGGHNHRFALYDGVLIKDNHIQAAGGIPAAVKRAREQAPHLLRVEVETETLAQVNEALAAGADIVMLDNMELETLRAAVELCRGKALSEASGGVNEKTVRAIAETGVDLISVGALTHSVTALDISLDWK